MFKILFCLFVICLSAQHTVGKCSEAGDVCDYQEWTKIVKPIRDAYSSGNSASLRTLLIQLSDNLKSIKGYENKICYVHYDDNYRSVYNYGYDCHSDNKCYCGSQIVGSPAKTYELLWDAQSQGCRRKTGEGCSEFGFIPEQQNCMTDDVCSEGICTPIGKVQGPVKKKQIYPKVGDSCIHSTWMSLYKPYLDARDEVEQKEGFENEAYVEVAEEKSMTLYSNLKNSIEERPEVSGEVCFTTDHVLQCAEDNKCVCNHPYVPDAKTKTCRTNTGETCFTRCIHLPEDQCLSSDHCFTYDIYKGLAICYVKGFYPARKTGRNVEKGAEAKSIGIKENNENLEYICKSMLTSILMLGVMILIYLLPSRPLLEVEEYFFS